MVFFLAWDNCEEKKVSKQYSSYTMVTLTLKRKCGALPNPEDWKRRPNTLRIFYMRDIVTMIAIKSVFGAFLRWFGELLFSASPLRIQRVRTFLEYFDAALFVFSLSDSPGVRREGSRFTALLTFPGVAWNFVDFLHREGLEWRFLRSPEYE